MGKVRYRLASLAVDWPLHPLVLLLPQPTFKLGEEVINTYLSALHVYTLADLAIMAVNSIQQLYTTIPNMLLENATIVPQAPAIPPKVVLLSRDKLRRSTTLE